MNPTKPLVIVLLGPTASGKTSVAVQLAKHFNTVVLSADSRQFYKEMTIGTSIPTISDLKTVKHHYIQHLSYTRVYTNASVFRLSLTTTTICYTQVARPSKKR